MNKKKNIPVHKIRITHPQTHETGWTFRMTSIGTLTVEDITERLGRRLFIDNKMAAAMFDQIAREMIYYIQEGFSIDMGVLGYLHPKIKNPGWQKNAEDLNLHGTSGFLNWEPSKRTKNEFRNIGCTLDWVQIDRNRKKAASDESIPDDDADDFQDDDYPLNIE